MCISLYIYMCVCVCVCAHLCVYSEQMAGWLPKEMVPYYLLGGMAKDQTNLNMSHPHSFLPLSLTHTHTIIYQPCSPMYPSLSASLSQQRAVACLLRAATVSTTDSTNSHFLPLTYTHSTSLCNAAASDVFVGLSLYYIPVRLKRPPGVILSN